jgi:ribosomal protein L7/L12
MNFERNLRAIAATPVHMSLNEAILLADALADAARPTTRYLYDCNTHEGRVAWVKQDTECMNLLRDGKKIHAIKRVRQVMNGSLLEAKNAVDEAGIGVYTYNTTF